MVRLSDHISDNHHRACKALGFAWHTGGTAIWLELTPVWIARLSAGECAAAAYSFLKALDHENQYAVFDTLFRSYGMPIPPLLDHVQEASDWAFFAGPKQRKATALACFDNMHPTDQAAFIEYASQRRAA